MLLKFTMDLVWHNCTECPPKEKRNDYLLLTDGEEVWDATWNDGEWYGDNLMPYSADGCYWADIKQTVQGVWRKTEMIL